MFYVYQHLKKNTSTPFYVGKGSKERAWFKGRRNIGWKNMVNKYGYDVDIIKYFEDEDEAILFENQLIKEYREKGVVLVNQTKYSEGGKSYSYTDEIKAKQSLGQIGTKRPKNKEWRKKVSKAHKGRKILWADKIGDALRGIPKNHPNPKKKPIQQYTLDNQLINEYDSATTAGKHINQSGNTIADAAAGRQKSAYGFLWKYK